MNASMTHHKTDDGYVVTGIRICGIKSEIRAFLGNDKRMTSAFYCIGSYGLYSRKITNPATLKKIADVIGKFMTPV